MSGKRVEESFLFHFGLGIAAKILAAILLLLIIALLDTCTSKAEPLWGTWVNQEYKHGWFDWREVFSSNGQVLAWQNGKPADQSCNEEIHLTVSKKWTDSEGSTWYSVAAKVCIPPYSDAKAIKEYGLLRVNAGHNVLEEEWSTIDLFEQFGTLSGKHYTYYRE